MCVSRPEPISVTIRYLARYAELVGRESETRQVPPATTVAQLLDTLRADLPGARTIPAKPLCALNFRQARGEERLRDGDEIALLPPMAGG